MEIHITVPQITCIRCKAAAPVRPREVRYVRGLTAEDDAPLWQVTVADRPPGWAPGPTPGFAAGLCPDCVAAWVPSLPQSAAPSAPSPSPSPLLLEAEADPLAVAVRNRIRSNIPAIVRPANTPVRLQGPEQTSRVTSNALPVQPHVIAPQALQPTITPSMVRRPTEPAGARVDAARPLAPTDAPSAVRTTASAIQPAAPLSRVEVQKRSQSIVVEPTATPIPHDAKSEIPSAQRTSFPEPIVKPR